MGARAAAGACKCDRAAPDRGGAGGGAQGEFMDADCRSPLPYITPQVRGLPSRGSSVAPVALLWRD
eukprot:3108112-Pyramimonas_sp.AAC.2